MKFTPRAALGALFAALAITLAATDANIIAYFIGNSMKTAVLAQVGIYFLPASLLLLVFSFLGGFLGLYRNRWISLATGFVASSLALVLGILINLLGQNISQIPFASIVDSVWSLSVIFVTAATVTTVTAGTALARRFAKGSTRSRQIALVRAPAPNLADGLVTHIKRKKVDIDLANAQWDAYVDTLNACGWQTVEVEPSAHLADSVFVEDTVVMLGNVAVITSPGAESREEEIIATEAAVRQLGVRIERITQPGTLDGGDVLKIGSTIYVGSGGRTNGEGIRQFRAIASKLGYTVVAVPVTKVLHLKSAVTALPDGTVIGYAPLVDNADIFPRFQPVPEEKGTAVVVLDQDLLLMSKAAPKTAALLESLGYEVVTVDISEYEKLEGCVTCLSVRVR